MRNLIGKTISIFLVIAVLVSIMPLGSVIAGVRPSVSVSAPSKSSIKVGDFVSYTITFANATDIKLSSDYVTLNGFTANVSISGTGDVRVVTLSNVQGAAGNKNIIIKAGAAENYNGQSLATPKSISFSLTENTQFADNVKPSVSIGAPDVNSINVGGTVKYTVTFSDNVGISKIDLSDSYIVLNGFKASVNVSGSGNTRTVTLSNIQGTAGNKTISIKAGAAEDAAGNKSLATPNSLSFTLNDNSKVEEDKIRPSISISEPNFKQIYTGETVTYVVSFADNKGIAKVNMTNDYVMLNGFTADVKITGTGDTRTITLSNIKGNIGINYNISIKAGAAEDAAGNSTLQTPNSISFQIIEKGNDNIIPENENTGKLDNEPNTGVETLPLLPIMASSICLLSVSGVVITKRIYY